MTRWIDEAEAFHRGLWKLHSPKEAFQEDFAEQQRRMDTYIHGLKSMINKFEPEVCMFCGGTNIHRDKIEHTKECGCPQGDKNAQR